MFDPYIYALTLGGVGLGAMAVLGLGSHGHGGHGHGGHGHAHAGHGSGTHPQDTHTHGVSDRGERAASGARWWLLLLSPRVAFSLLVGFGAAGLVLRSILAGPWLVLAAVGGAVGFEALLVRPLWNLLLRFASKPALTLDHGVMDEAEAVTAFNREGDGLVKLVVDGQVVQLLATLVDADRAAGARVRAGDRLIVEVVDSARQRCTVSRRALS